MPGIQEWIHQLEEGAGANYLKVGVAVLAFVGLAAIFDVREYKNFRNPEAMDAAQVARNLAEGGGFSTETIRPFGIYLLQSREEKGREVVRGAHPDLANGPVYPLLLAGLMKVLPFDFEIAPTQERAFRTYQPEVLITLFNQGLFLVLLLVVFWVARKVFDSGVAWLATVVLAGSLVLWQFSSSGLPTMVLLLALYGAVWLLLKLEEDARAEQPRGTGWYVGMGAGVGVLLGIGGLSQYSFLWLALPVLIWCGLYLGVRRVPVMVTVFVALVVMVTPWTIRNYQLSGSFFGLAGYAVFQGTTPFPGNSLERIMSEPEVEAAMSKMKLEEYGEKLLVNGAEVLRDLPHAGGSWLGAFFLVGLLVPFVNPALKRLRVFAVLCLVVLIPVQALGRTYLAELVPGVNSENLLILLVPLFFIFGSGLFFILLDQIEFPQLAWRRLAVVAFAVVMCLPLVFRFFPPRSYPVAFPPYYPPLIQEVAGWMGEDELTMSDMPWAVAWYGDRKSLLVTLDAPTTLEAARGSDFFEINDFYMPVQSLLLTPLTLDARFMSEMLEGRQWAWGRFVLDSLMRTNVPQGFPLRHAPSGFLPEHLYLTDQPRWRQREN